MTINSADFQIDSAGNVRRATSPATTSTYTVLDLHAWLQDLADNINVVGDDNVSILSNNPSKLDGPRDALVASRLNLINGFNIDDTVAQFLQKGSIKQASGATMYSGLKTIGSIVAASPMYVVQGTSKVLSAWWGTGHIQILLKVKAANTFIDHTLPSGSSPGWVTVYSRKFGQTYGHFDVDMTAGGENPAAITTSMDSSITLTYGAATALSSKVTITVGAATLDLGNGNGVRNYSGTIALDGTITLAQLYNYLQAITSESTTTNVGTTPGWNFRGLAGFSENTAAPFGSYQGGKFFFAQGWKVTGIMASESLNYQLIDNTGATQNPPNVTTVSVTNLVAGDTVLVGRDDGTSSVIQNEYTLAGAHSSGATTIVINEAIKSDTPSAGTIRVAGVRLPYTSYNAGTKTFTLTSATTQGFSNGAAAFVPFIDLTAGGTSASNTFLFSSAVNMRAIVRNNTAVIQEYNAPFTVGSSGGSATVIRNSDQ